MIASIAGTVARIGLDQVVIEVGGIGLAVRVTPNTVATLRRGEQARLATSLVVREDSLTLFGFATDAARQLFELVQSVGGVGPKIALALLAVLDPDELRTALANGDTTALTRAPGIGKKGAERLVLELRDRVGPASGATGPASQAPEIGSTQFRPQLTDALVGLGFSVRQADDAITAVTRESDDPAVVEGDVGVLLRRALRLLGKAR